MSLVPAIIAMTVADRVADRFLERGATSPATAMTLDQLGITRKAGIFAIMEWHRHIVKAGDDRYYLDASSWDEAAGHRIHDHVAALLEDISGVHDEGPLA